MTKIYILIVVFLASGWGFTFWGKTTLENDLNQLKTEYLSLEDKFEGTMQQKMFLEKELEKRNEIALETCERVCQIEKRAEEEKNKGGFAWDSALPNDAVVKQLLSD